MAFEQPNAVASLSLLLPLHIEIASKYRGSGHPTSPRTNFLYIIPFFIFRSKSFFLPKLSVSPEILSRYRIWLFGFTLQSPASRVWSFLPILEIGLIDRALVIFRFFLMYLSRPGIWAHTTIQVFLLSSHRVRRFFYHCIPLILNVLYGAGSMRILPICQFCLVPIGLWGFLLIDLLSFLQFFHLRFQRFFLIQLGG